MPYAEERGRCALWALECCDQAEAYVTQWRKLWQQGKFGDAYFIARCAVQADPNNRDARHALVVSQIVNENSRQQLCPDLGFCSQYSGGSSFVRLNGDEPWNGLMPAGTLTPDLNIPAKRGCCEAGACCPVMDCPLVALFDMVFGGFREAKTSGCGPCPTAIGHGVEAAERMPSCKAVADECGMHIVRGPNGSQVIWIIREPQATVTRGPELVVPPFPPVPTPMVSRTASLPPPHLAPPPPPIMTSEGMVIPVPVAPPYGYPPQQYARPTLYDPAAELCEAVTPLPVMPKHVQITQTARHVQLSSPNYSAQCERIRGGAHGELILEGNVRLISRRHGQSMTINAQRVLLNVKDDQFVVEQADGMDQGRVNIAPVGCTTTGDGETRQWRGAGQGIPAAPIRVHGPIGY
jgi:hypothetical protein